LKLGHTDTLSLSARIDSKLSNFTEIDPIFNGSLARGITSADTVAWNKKLGATDTLSLSRRIDTKLSIHDTAAILSTYFKVSDTMALNLAARFASKLGPEDTISLSNRIDAKTGLPQTGNSPGDILYWDGTKWVRLSKGLSGQILQFQNGLPIWSGSVFATLATSSVRSVTSTSAIVGGEILTDGEEDITNRGIVYGISPNPTLANTILTVGQGVGSFSTTLSGLNSNTTYYVRAYATNRIGTSFGNELSFTTLPSIGHSQVTTQNITSITSTTAITGGNIITDGGPDIIQRGIVYGTNPNPTLDGLFTQNGSGWGSFTSILSNLVPNTTYYVRAYAINSTGEVYGDERSFITLSIEMSINIGLLAYYPFNGNAIDESGNGFHGIVNGAVLTTDRKELRNAAYSFSTNQSIIVPTSQYNNTYPITISLWYKATQLPAGLNGNLFSKYIPGLWNGYQILIGDFRNVSNLGGSVNNGFGVNPFYLRSHTDRVIGYYDEPHFGQENILYGTWYHFVFMVDDYGGKIFVNGNLVDSHPWTGTKGACDNSLYWKIGGYYDTWYFGKIDDIRVYDRVLTQEEISYLYEN
jgi:hypothetical protein